MVRRMVSVALAACAAVTIAGCAAPAPARNVNAYLPKNAAVYGEDRDTWRTADTLVVAQCTQVEEYATTVKGNWVQHWYVTYWQVIRVERGAWPEETVSFVFHDSWPTAESGIALKAAPRVYYKGAVVGFCIDTSEAKPVIVAQQARSRVPMHGTLQRPKYDIRDPESTRLFQRVVEAARLFLQQANAGGGALTVTEEYDTFFVVETRAADDSVALKVEKGSYRVTEIPSLTQAED